MVVKFANKNSKQEFFWREKLNIISSTKSNQKHELCKLNQSINSENCLLKREFIKSLYIIHILFIIHNKKSFFGNLIISDRRMIAGFSMSKENLR